MIFPITVSPPFLEDFPLPCLITRRYPQVIKHCFSQISHLFFDVPKQVVFAVGMCEDTGGMPSNIPMTVIHYGYVIVHYPANHMSKLPVDVHHLFQYVKFNPKYIII